MSLYCSRKTVVTMDTEFSVLFIYLFVCPIQSLSRLMSVAVCNRYGCSDGRCEGWFLSGLVASCSMGWVGWGGDGKVWQV